MNEDEMRRKMNEPLPPDMSPAEFDAFKIKLLHSLEYGIPFAGGEFFRTPAFGIPNLRPGRRRLDRQKYQDRNKYSGAELRAIRAEKGVGRPPAR